MYDEEEKLVYAAHTLYREVGYYLLLRKHYDDCLPQFDQSTHVDDKNVRNRQGRAWARNFTLNYSGALFDVKKALRVDPTNLRTLAMKALFKFMNTDFENAYIKFIRGTWVRTMPPHYSNGEKVCKQVIENCIGKRSGHPLRDYHDIIRLLAKKRNDDFHKGYQYKPQNKVKKKIEGRRKKEMLIIDKLFLRFADQVPERLMEEKGSKPSLVISLTEKDVNELLFKPERISEYQPLQRCTTNIDNYLTERYLQSMVNDKKFLMEVSHDKKLRYPIRQRILEIKPVAKKGTNDLLKRQEILRTRIPFYTKKYLQGVLRPALLKRQMEGEAIVREIVEKNVDKFFVDLEEARTDKDLDLFVQIVDKAKTYIDKTQMKYLPKKKLILRTLYTLIGETYMDMYRLDNEKDDLLQAIYDLYGVFIRKPEIRIKNPVLVYITLGKRKAEERLLKAATPLEAVWLYYELCKYLLALQNLEYAELYANRCVLLACMINNFIWAVNGTMMLIRMRVKQKIKKLMEVELDNARKYAKNIKNPDLKDYIDRCFAFAVRRDDEVL